MALDTTLEDHRSQSPEPVELYMKVTVQDGAALVRWACHLFEVDTCDIEVAAAALAHSMVGPFSLTGGDIDKVQAHFIGMAVKGGRKGPRRKGGASLCVPGQS